MLLGQGEIDIDLGMNVHGLVLVPFFTGTTIWGGATGLKASGFCCNDTFEFY